MRVAAWSHVLLLAYVHVQVIRAEPEGGRVNFILVGATGDLAAKYLWKSLYRIYNRTEGPGEVRVFAAARDSADVGYERCATLIQNGLNCAHGDNLCAESKERFLRDMQYVQLKRDAHWEAFCGKLNANSADNELIRVFYLSIPPFAYDSVSLQISTYCRTSADLRIVFEKPFGDGYDDSKALAEKVSSRFDDASVYHIDHYLGKSVLRDFLEIRASNPDLENMLNKRFVSRVDVVLSESIDVEGRTEFYNSVGVVRDVLQNHATEMLALLAAPIPDGEPPNSNGFQEMWQDSKAAFLESLHGSSLLTGRYDAYEQQVEKGPPYMPTFAAVQLQVTAPETKIDDQGMKTGPWWMYTMKWEGVPFVLVSGKRMGVRESYIRVAFKNSSCSAEPRPRGVHEDFSLRDTSTETEIETEECQPGVLHVHVQGQNRPPEIWASGIPLKISLPGWTRDNNAKATRYVRESQVGAYDHLVEAVVARQKTLFVSTKTLLASWRLWGPLAAEADLKDQFVYTEADFEGAYVSLDPDGSVSLKKLSAGDDDDASETMMMNSKNNEHDEL